MEFTTPPSYATTVVDVGSITNASSGEILFAGADCTAEHTEVKGDAEVDWPEPAATKYVWRGKTPDGKDAVATLEGPLGDRLDRVDIMGELPGFIKQLASTASGTRPYIYQASQMLRMLVLMLIIYSTRQK
jgi:Svf1-like C-terminal lipocalin-like domain